MTGEEGATGTDQAMVWAVQLYCVGRALVTAVGIHLCIVLLTCFVHYVEIMRIN